MKRRDLIRALIDAGCHLKRHGSNHDVYVNPNNGKKAPVPRHSEIKETLADLIKKAAWHKVMLDGGWLLAVRKF